MRLGGGIRPAVTLAAFVTTGLLAASCMAGETGAGYADGDRVWTLTELNGAPFTARATLSFPEPDQIAGQAPCNRYFGPMTAPYPAFETGAVASTKMACPDLEAEDSFFATLAQMTHAAVMETTLILRNDQGAQMVFTASE